ncbi:MAG: HAD family phosphatase [Bacteroidaceae bacterium]|nr:HAD family phosphatase [Bacteroidaceae bacterium]
MVRNLVFDFGKVLVDYDFVTTLDGFVEEDNDRAGFKRLLLDPAFVDETDIGFMSLQDIMLREQRRHPQWAEAFRRFDENFLEFIKGEIPGMHVLLSRLRDEGFRLYGLTNWSNTVYRVIGKYDILRMMDGTVISSEEKIVKPDVRIYLRLCEKFGLNIDECIFTDDKQVNVDGALRAGMKAILFRDAQQYEHDLREMLRVWGN